MSDFAQPRPLEVSCPENGEKPKQHVQRAATAVASRNVPVADPRRLQLPGKRVLFVCCGHDGLDSKRFTFELSHSLGVRVFLLEDPTNSLAAEMAQDGILEKFLPVDMTPRPSLLNECLEVLQQTQLTVGQFHGVCTFWDDCVALTARICHALDLPGHPVEAVDIAYNKHLTRVCMEKASLPIPKFWLIKSSADVAEAKRKVGAPAILKPMHGASSLAVMKVESSEKFEDAYIQTAAALAKYHAEGELMGLTFDDEINSKEWIVCEEFIDGAEMDVDLVLYNGKVVHSVVSDDWPQIEPWFAEHGNNCPSLKSPEIQNKAKDIAIRSAMAMGFRDGILHCEVREGVDGVVHLLEINCRMGGGPVYALHKGAFGVDLVEEQLYAALRVGNPTHLLKPRAAWSCGEKFFRKSMTIPQSFCEAVSALAAMPNVVEATPLVAPGEEIVGVVDGFPTRCCRIVVHAPTAIAAQTYAEMLLGATNVPEVLQLQK